MNVVRGVESEKGKSYHHELFDSFIYSKSPSQLSLVSPCCILPMNTALTWRSWLNEKNVSIAQGS